MKLFANTDLNRTCRHEAGHAVACVLIGGEVRALRHSVRAGTRLMDGTIINRDMDGLCEGSVELASPATINEWLNSNPIAARNMAQKIKRVMFYYVAGDVVEGDTHDYNNAALSLYRQFPNPSDYNSRRYLDRIRELNDWGAVAYGAMQLRVPVAEVERVIENLLRCAEQIFARDGIRGAVHSVASALRKSRGLLPGPKVHAIVDPIRRSESEQADGAVEYQCDVIDGLWIG